MIFSITLGWAGVGPCPWALALEGRGDWTGSVVLHAYFLIQYMYCINTRSFSSKKQHERAVRKKVKAKACIGKKN